MKQSLLIDLWHGFLGKLMKDLFELIGLENWNCNSYEEVIIKSLKLRF